MSVQMYKQVFVFVLALVLLLTGSTSAQEREYNGWDLHRMRTHAFSKVQMASNLCKSQPASDPAYAQNSQAMRQNQRSLPGREITAHGNGSYSVLYSPQKLVNYSRIGKTEAVGYTSTSGFPEKKVLYHYPSCTLKTVTYSLSPKDVFVFNESGNLIKGTLEKAFWERPTLEKQVTAIGFKILVANKIKEKISFSIEQEREIVNAFSTEMFNRVRIAKGILAYIESDDELAAILSHEIAHIILRHRHIYPKVTHDEALQSWFRIPVEPRRDSYEYSLAQEKELDADRMGLRMMVRAGYQPEAMISITLKINADGSESDYSTHPSGSHRIRALQNQIRRMRQSGDLPVAPGL